MSGTARHVRKNRRFWDRTSDEYQAEHARQLNRFDRPVWGIWGLPESRLRVLGDVEGKDVLELGCGGAQWSICLARMGARPVGLDLSIAQLRHAERLMAGAGVSFPIVNADAERVPFAVDVCRPSRAGEVRPLATMRLPSSGRSRLVGSMRPLRAGRSSALSVTTASLPSRIASVPGGRALWRRSNPAPVTWSLCTLLTAPVGTSPG